MFRRSASYGYEGERRHPHNQFPRRRVHRAEGLFGGHREFPRRRQHRDDGFLHRGRYFPREDYRDENEDDFIHSPLAAGASGAAGALLAGPLGAAAGPLLYNVATGQGPFGRHPGANWFNVGAQSLGGYLGASAFPGNFLAPALGAGGAAYLTQPGGGFFGGGRQGRRPHFFGGGGYPREHYGFF
jgi:hypothetical protein